MKNVQQGGAKKGQKSCPKKTQQYDIKAIQRGSVKRDQQEVAKKVQKGGAKKFQHSVFKNTEQSWVRCGACHKYNHNPNPKFCRWALERKTRKKQNKVSPGKNPTAVEIEKIAYHISLIDQIKSSKASIMISFFEDYLVTRDNYWPFKV